ncbi:MAG TPA: homoserine kinase [Aggregatilineaceae bacterium]|nr:homoserine kinase [Aggregatilineaceae bacterium]
MHKISVSVPAVCTNLGPGYDVLGLALNLRTTVEMALREDDRFAIQVRGEGEDRLPEDLYNPAMMAAITLFQTLERAPAGLSVMCASRIPLDAGLGARVALAVGGLMAANNLLGSPLSREDLIALAGRLSGRPEAVVAAMRGGLSVCSASGDLLYRTLDIEPLLVVLAIPDLPLYPQRGRDDLPQVVPLGDAVHNIGRALLVVEALRDGDFELLGEALSDHLHEPYRRADIPGYHAVVEAACRAGASGVALCGAGPAMAAFAAREHAAVEQAMADAFERAGVPARTLTVAVDTQGVVINVVD